MFSTDSEQAIRFWSDHASRFQSECAIPGSFYQRRSVLVADLIARRYPGGSVLDVGCGTGFLCRELARRGLDVHGTDVSPEMVERTIEVLTGETDDPEYRVRPTQGRTPPFPQQFDVVVALGVFPYVADHATFAEWLSEQASEQGGIVASCTRRRSLFVLKEIAGTICFRRPWRQACVVAANLARTGVWSGGWIDRNESRQVHSTRRFCGLFDELGFRETDSIDLWNLKNWDERIERRGTAARWAAARLGWCHVGHYRRSDAPIK
jgi:2-polyprenyl-3-methyl-5-hydroxy-6-metoxy-1,4-benzoquinol methylase